MWFYKLEASITGLPNVSQVTEFEAFSALDDLDELQTVSLAWPIVLEGSADLIFVCIASEHYPQRTE